MCVDNLRLYCIGMIARHCRRHRKALYEIGKRPYNQIRSSDVLKGAMNLTMCLEIETGGWRRLFRDQNFCYGLSPRHRPYTTKNEGPSMYIMDIV